MDNPLTIQETVEAIKITQDKLQFWGKWQFRSLAWGVFFFIIWHILRMALN